MKKKLFAVLLALVMAVGLLPTAAFAAEGEVPVDADHFPDANFRAYIEEWIDGNGDKMLSSGELTVTTLELYGKGIKTMQGIEYFTALEYLNCSGNSLTELDVSQNTALTRLNCYGNQLTSLKINAGLKTLSCNNNPLGALDVSAATGLESLTVSDAGLTTLDLSSNTELEVLFCDFNELTTLDLSSNTKLEYLSFAGNQLTTLDLSNNTALKKVQCDQNKLESLDVSNTALTQLICPDNQLTSLKLNQGLQTLNCQNNQLTALVVGPDLGYLNCMNNQLTNLDLSQNTAMKMLYGINNKLSTLDVGHLAKLQTLYVGNNQLTALDVSKNTALTALGVQGNRLTALDVSKNTALTELNAANDQLTTLDVSKNTLLNQLLCNGNKLSALDVANNTVLVTLNCGGNQLTALDVSNQTKLQNLKCENNRLTVLNVNNSPDLDVLNCSGNQLTSLDNEYAIYDLDCDDNVYSITVGEDRTFDLTTLPGSFDVSKASDWAGGTVSGSILTLDAGADTVTYTYNVHPYTYADFTLKVAGTSDEHTHTYGAWSMDETGHWKACADSDCPDAAGSVKDKAAHVYDSDADTDCNVCGYVRTVAPASDYKFIEGADSAWTQDTTGTLTFRANGNLAKFTGVMVDGKLVDPENYTAVSGSTVITLKSAYLATLSAGTHELTALYTDGECSIDFQVKEAGTDSGNDGQGGANDAKPGTTASPKTGDAGDLLQWTALLMVSGGTLAAAAVAAKKKAQRK